MPWRSKPSLDLGYIQTLCEYSGYVLLNSHSLILFIIIIIIIFYLKNKHTNIHMNMGWLILSILYFDSSESDLKS